MDGDDGNVTRVVTDEGPGFDSLGNATNKYSASRMVYAKNQRAVTYMIDESWNWKGPRFAIVDYTVGQAVGYRYDGSRERYMERRFDPIPFASGQLVAQFTAFMDYDNGQPYSDFLGRGYDLAMGTFGRDTNGDPDPTTAVYDHRDMIGTMRGNSHSDGTGMIGPVYTAFGEQKSGSPTRFGYAGAHGYQTNGTFPFLHVGARYYDPESGRFLQRDPTGIRGGLNVYAYVRNVPTIGIDPDGLKYRPPGATGPPDKGFTDGFWSKVHYTAGWGAGKAGMSFSATICAAIRWEVWEPKNWPFEFNENLLNQIGDVFVAGKGWYDAHH